MKIMAEAIQIREDLVKLWGLNSLDLVIEEAE